MKILAHAHTTYSRDGSRSPAELAALAARHGFGAVLLSDHFEHLTEESFWHLVSDCDREAACLLVPGYERSWDGYHICAFGLRSWIDATDVTEWSKLVRASGGLLCLAHPARYDFEAPEKILTACDAVEVWNSKRPYDGLLAPNPAAAGLLRPGLLAMAGQDFHRRLDLSSVALRLRKRPRSATELMEALRAGQFSIGSRWLRFDRHPPRRLWPLLRGWQRLRPMLWAGPIRVFKTVRRAARRWGKR